MVSPAGVKDWRCVALCIIASLLLYGPSSGATYRVDSSAAVTDLIESATLAAGDEIVWVAGTYSDQEIELNGVDGNADHPITFRAEKPGGVILQGESQLRANVKWWVIEGFHFDGSSGGPNAYNPVQFRGSGDVGAEHVRLTNCAFTSLDNGEGTAKWVLIYGRFNRVDHCHFSDKVNKGALLTVELGGLGMDETASHVIEWNFFADVSRNEGSDNETIRIGFSGDQQKKAQCLVQHNLFLRCSGEAEVVSNKSSYNSYTANTFRQCNGSLVLRHGHHATVNGNFFLGEGAEDAGGIRVNDSHHRIYNNYMQDLTGLTWNAALSLEGGEKPSGGDSNGYQKVDDVTIVHNSIIHCAKSIHLSDKHGHRPPTGLVANNLVAVEKDTKTLIDARLPTDGLAWTQNLFFGSERIPELPGLRVDPRLGKVGMCYRPDSRSPVVDGAIGSHDFVAVDIEGQPRPTDAKDIGADEFAFGDVGRPFPSLLGGEDVGTTFLKLSE